MSDNSSADTKVASIDVTQVRLRRDERGRLVLRTAPQAEPIENVRVARCFPWSLRDGYVSIRDHEDNERVLLADVQRAETDTRQLIEHELEVQEFIPAITAVEAIDDSFGVMIWNVRTDRGPIELQIKTNDDIRRIDQQRVLLKDHAGGLFEIPALAALDAKSQRLVEDHMG